MHKAFLVTITTILLLGITASANAGLKFWEKDKTETEKQQEIKQKKIDIKVEKAEILKMTKDTLKRLYELQPAARKTIARSAGYAVFTNFGMKLFIAGSGMGEGIAFNNSNKNFTYMKMVELQAGLGYGIKKFRQVWIFEKQSDLNEFINSGWEFSGQASAAAQVNGQGGFISGAMSISPGVWLYQMIDDGLAAEFTGKGTKYYKDDDLN
jgi:lipid-binding SYLF domain-containing protein